MNNKAKNPEVVKEWIRRLESGEYEQKRGFLRVNNCFCQAGIFCDVVNPNGWKQQEGQNSNLYSWESSYNEIPSIIEQYIDFILIWDCTGMNDKGKSFKEIAQYAREQLDYYD